jgi:predicted nucleic acid-binding Zn ribbon protein|tara:strand:- start:30 stop:530 length:501 start_codon:yes stop_codon:yes gene_type:complete
MKRFHASHRAPAPRSSLGDGQGRVTFEKCSRRKNGGRSQSRTGDTRIFSPLLYQLSYPATPPRAAGGKHTATAPPRKPFRALDRVQLPHFNAATSQAIMPTYIYETIPKKKGQKPRRFEVVQKMKDKPLKKCPETGEPVQRVITGGCGVVFHGPSIMSMNVPRGRK